MPFMLTWKYNCLNIDYCNLFLILAFRLPFVQVWATEVETVTKINRDPIISTVYTTVYHTDVTYSTLVSSVFATITVTNPVTQVLKVPFTVTTFSTKPVTLQVSTSCTQIH